MELGGGGAASFLCILVRCRGQKNGLGMQTQAAEASEWVVSHCDYFLFPGLGPRRVWMNVCIISFSYTLDIATLGCSSDITRRSS